MREIITRALDEGTFTVMACSALKAAYRDLLQGGDARVQFVHLTGPRALIEERLKARRNHFMPRDTVGQPVGDAGTAGGRADFQLRKIARRNCDGADSGFGHCRGGLNLCAGFGSKKASAAAASMATPSPLKGIAVL